MGVCWWKAFDVMNEDVGDDNTRGCCGGQHVKQGFGNPNLSGRKTF